MPRENGVELRRTSAGSVSPREHRPRRGCRRTSSESGRRRGNESTAPSFATRRSASLARRRRSMRQVLLFEQARPIASAPSSVTRLMSSYAAVPGVRGRQRISSSIVTPCTTPVRWTPGRCRRLSARARSEGGVARQEGRRRQGHAREGRQTSDITCVTDGKAFRQAQSVLLSGPAARAPLSGRRRADRASFRPCTRAQPNRHR